MLSYFKNLENIERYSFISDKLLEMYFDKVFKHMVPSAHQNKCQINSSMYMSKYIMTFFTGVLPISICCRIYDIFIFENEKIIFRAILAIFKFLEPLILDKANMGDIIQYVSQPGKFMTHVTQDAFIDQCLKFTFSQTLIGKLDFEYNSRQKAD